MWYITVALIVEVGVAGYLLTRYRTRRTQRRRSDALHLAQEYYKTEKLRVDINDIKAQRSLLQEMEDAFEIQSDPLH